jgi:hypothetical protein
MTYSMDEVPGSARYPLQLLSVCRVMDGLWIEFTSCFDYDDDCIAWLMICRELWQRMRFDGVRMKRGCGSGSKDYFEIVLFSSNEFESLFALGTA